MNTFPFDGLALVKFANFLDSGYLKLWKANSMVRTLQDIPGILRDDDRLYTFLTKSLAMESFSDTDIRQVLGWIKSHF